MRLWAATPERDGGGAHARGGCGGVCGAVRDGAGRCGAVRGSGGGGGAHRRLGAALVAWGAVCGRARLRRLRGGGARLGGGSARLWGMWVVQNPFISSIL